MKYITRHQDQASFEAAKSTLLTPQLAYINSIVSIKYWKTPAIDPTVLTYEDGSEETFYLIGEI